MALHILQLGPYPPPEGGISRNMLAIRNELLERGDKCSIIATSRSSRVVSEADVYHPRSGLGLIKLLASMRFDVLHLHIGGDVDTRVLLLISTAAVFGRGKCIMTLHSGAYPLTEHGVSSKPGSIRSLIFRRFDRIIAINEQLADVFRRCGVPPKRIKIIPPFSLQSPDPNLMIPSELLEFFAKHSPVLLAVGGLESDYDPLFQIEAMGDILNDFPNAGLMIVGDGSMRDEVKQAVEKSGHAGNICIAGNVEHAITLHLIKDADILLRTTLFDGDAISVRESLYLGTPVIATDNGLRPEGTHLIDIGDRESLLKKISEIAGHEKKPFETQPPQDSNIKAVVNLYEELA